MELFAEYGRRTALRRWKIIAALALGAILSSLTHADDLGAAATNSAAREFRPGSREERVLFIVQTSSSMRDISNASRQAVANLVANGLQRRLRDGDTFGLWTFNDEVHADFPMQVWRNAEAAELAGRVFKYLGEQPHRKKARFEPLFTQLRAVLESVRDVTVFVVTDGKPALTGTTFDAAVKSACLVRGGERKRAEVPFVVTFVAREGGFVSAAVTLPGEPLVLPERPTPVVAQPVKPAAPLPPKPTTVARRTNASIHMTNGGEFAPLPRDSVTIIPFTSSTPLTPLTNSTTATATLSVPTPGSPVPAPAVAASSNSLAVLDTNVVPAASTVSTSSPAMGLRGPIREIRAAPVPTEPPPLRVGIAKPEMVQAKPAVPPFIGPVLPPRGPLPLTVAPQPNPAIPGELNVSARELRPHPTPGTHPDWNFTPRFELALLLVALVIWIFLLVLRRANRPRESFITRSMGRR